jgi:hypothetical protein
MNNLFYPLSRPVACVLALGLVATCAWSFCGRPLWEAIADYRESRQAIAKGRARSAELRSTLDRIHARLEAKDRIIRDLIAGRINADDAGWLYADLPDPPPDFLEHLRETEQGSSDHERLCRHLIDYACDYMESGAARQALQDRLLQDLENNLKHFRRRILPVPVE